MSKPILVVINFLILALAIGLYRTSLEKSTLVSANASDREACKDCNRVSNSFPKIKLWKNSRLPEKNAIGLRQIKQQLSWMKQWQTIDRGSWGLNNLEVIKDSTQKFDRVLRVRYPANSASPTVAKKEGNPLGGAQFYSKLNISPQDSFTLSYYVRFSENFNFVKGGKLPGLFGAMGNNGGNIPNGTDGFSTRYMWRRNGDGEIYAYLPTSKKHGTSIGRGTWQFSPGKWYHLRQQITLNQPDRQNGSIRVWVDDRKVIDRTGLVFRTIKNLKIDGILFSTFFGGNDSSWATPQDVYVDFANFSVYYKD
jgi:hypothetical protein